jgi:methyl-accepting chemotaxis protein
MEKTRSNEARVNRTAMILFTVLTSIICLAYIVQLIKGEAGMEKFLPVEIFDLGPMIIGWILYKKNPDTDYIKHVIGIGYGLFYLTVCLITTNTVLVFVYAIPTVILTAMFNDFRLSVTSGIGVSVIAIIHAVKFATSRDWADGAMADFEIEVLIMIIVSVFSIVVNKVITDINATRLQVINDTGEKNQHMLSEVMQVSGDLIKDVEEVSEKITQLATSSEETLASMREVQSGTTDTAESVQNQMLKTEEIQTQIENVTNASREIGSNTNDAVEAIREGRENIAKLISQSKASEEAGNNVVSGVEGLKASTAQMETIVSLIQSVASQTSLLALNASIEAARAGDAGRGFSVVAEEIGKLATESAQTAETIRKEMENLVRKSSDAIKKTDDITSIGANVSSVLKDTVTKINDLIRNVEDTVTGIQTISKLTEKCDASKVIIVDAMTSLSAISEENAASTEETSASMEELNATIIMLADSAKSLNDIAEQLRKDLSFFHVE